jgi:drug/metabolite transporter (DMT)-like permease
MYLQPLVGVSVASFLLSEPLRITLVTGGALILTGMTLVNYRSLTVCKK